LPWFVHREKTKGAIKNGQIRATGNIERLPVWFSLYVTSCSGLSIFNCLFGFLSMLPVALVCPFLIAPLIFSLCCQLLWFVRENQRGNQKWTSQSNWQNREKTKGAIKNGQTRALAT
jgi:hypothetical protein